MGLFIPQIKRDTEADSVRMAERIVVGSMRDALAYEKVAQAVAPFKSDGLRTGHKVLDDYQAVKALLSTAPDHIKSAINAQKQVSDYRLTQLLNRALRGDFEMVKGKLTGKLSPRKLAQQSQKDANQYGAHPTEASATEQA